MPFRSLPVIPSRRFFSVDIWSYRIKVLVCEVTDEGLKILGHSSVRQSRKNMLSGEISDMQWVLTAVDLALVQASEKAGCKPQDSIVSLHSHSIVSDVLSMNYVREHPSFPIEMSEIDEMVSKTEYTALDRVKIRCEKELWLPESEVRLAASLITSIVLDGKKIHNPIGFTGSQIQYRVMNTFVPRSGTAIVRNIFTALGQRVISFVPPATVFPKILETSDIFFEPFVTIDFWENQITVTLCIDWELQGTRIVPFGIRLFGEALKKVTPTLAFLDIETLTYDLSTLDDQQKQIFEKTVLFLWDSVLIALEDIAKIPLPARMILSGGIVRAPFVDFIQQAHTIRHPEYSWAFTPLEHILPVSWELRAPEFATTMALSQAAADMLSIAKNHSLSAMLRSILYRYE